ncbi:copper homeostasis protein CutC [Roseibium sp.]|uniref:copper homeostasis protein CutC n=1 Tax=Roseibium sp. TaxID=1936156 RepID=UPI003A972A5C
MQNKPVSSVLLEVCVDSTDGLAQAIAGGADRIELCSALSVGGLTPSAGFMKEAANSSIPVYPLLRPRDGDFCYSDAELDCLKVDIDTVRANELPGVVIGASREDGSLDVGALKLLADHAHGLDMTLHRAFDLVPDMREALEIAIELGFSRILTSGGESSAADGLETLQRLQKAAKGRITIMPGSGVKLSNIAKFQTGLKLTEIHSSCSVSTAGAGGKVRQLGFETANPKKTDAAVVAKLKAALSTNR